MRKTLRIPLIGVTISNKLTSLSAGKVGRVVRRLLNFLPGTGEEAPVVRGSFKRRSPDIQSLAEDTKVKTSKVFGFVSNAFAQSAALTSHGPVLGGYFGQTVAITGSVLQPNVVELDSADARLLVWKGCWVRWKETVHGGGWTDWYEVIQVVGERRFVVQPQFSVSEPSTEIEVRRTHDREMTDSPPTKGLVGNWAIYNVFNKNRQEYRNEHGPFISTIAQDASTPSTPPVARRSPFLYQRYSDGNGSGPIRFSAVFEITKNTEPFQRTLLLIPDGQSKLYRSYDGTNLSEVTEFDGKVCKWVFSDGGDANFVVGHGFVAMTTDYGQTWEFIVNAPGVRFNWGAETNGTLSLISEDGRVFRVWNRRLIEVSYRAARDEYVDEFLEVAYSSDLRRPPYEPYDWEEFPDGKLKTPYDYSYHTYDVNQQTGRVTWKFFKRVRKIYTFPANAEFRPISFDGTNILFSNGIVFDVFTRQIYGGQWKLVFESTPDGESGYYTRQYVPKSMTGIKAVPSYPVFFSSAGAFISGRWESFKNEFDEPLSLLPSAVCYDRERDVYLIYGENDGSIYETSSLSGDPSIVRLIVGQEKPVRFAPPEVRYNPQPAVLDTAGNLCFGFPQAVWGACSVGYAAVSNFFSLPGETQAFRLIADKSGAIKSFGESILPTLVNSNGNAVAPVSLAASKASSDDLTVLAVSPGGGLYRWVESSGEWETVFAEGEGVAVVIARDAINSPYEFAAIYTNGRLLETNDGGVNWVGISTPFAITVRSAVHAEAAGTLVVGDGGQALWRASWGMPLAPITSGVTVDLTFAGADDNQLYACDSPLSQMISVDSFGTVGSVMIPPEVEGTVVRDFTRYGSLFLAGDGLLAIVDSGGITVKETSPDFSGVIWYTAGENSAMNQFVGYNTHPFPIYFTFRGDSAWGNYFLYEPVADLGWDGVEIDFAGYSSRSPFVAIGGEVWKVRDGKVLAPVALSSNSTVLANSIELLVGVENKLLGGGASHEGCHVSNDGGVNWEYFPATGNGRVIAVTSSQSACYALTDLGMILAYDGASVSVLQPGGGGGFAFIEADGNIAVFNRDTGEYRYKPEIGGAWSGGTLNGQILSVASVSGMFCAIVSQNNVNKLMVSADLVSWVEVIGVKDPVYLLADKQNAKLYVELASGVILTSVSIVSDYFEERSLFGSSLSRFVSAGGFLIEFAGLVGPQLVESEYGALSGLIPFFPVSEEFRSSLFACVDGYLILFGTDEWDPFTGEWKHYRRRIRWSSPLDPLNFHELGASGTAELSGVGEFYCVSAVGRSVVGCDDGGVFALDRTGDEIIPFAYRRLAEGITSISNMVGVGEVAYFIGHDGELYRCSQGGVEQAGCPINFGTNEKKSLIFLPSVRSLAVKNTASEIGEWWLVNVDSMLATTMALGFSPDALFDIPGEGAGCSFESESQNLLVSVMSDVSPTFSDERGTENATWVAQILTSDVEVEEDREFRVLAATVGAVFEDKPQLFPRYHVGVLDSYDVEQWATEFMRVSDSGTRDGSITVTGYDVNGTGNTVFSNLIGTGDGVTTVFNTPVQAGRCQFFWGTTRIPRSGYIITGSHEVTFMSPPPSLVPVTASWNGGPGVRVRIGDYLEASHNRWFRISAIDKFDHMFSAKFADEMLTVYHRPTARFSEKEWQRLGLVRLLDRARFRVTILGEGSSNVKRMRLEWIGVEIDVRTEPKRWMEGRQ